jgi:hypothetical protein
LHRTHREPGASSDAGGGAEKKDHDADAAEEMDWGSMASYNIDYDKWLGAAVAEKKAYGLEKPLKDPKPTKTEVILAHSGHIGPLTSI